MKTRKKPFTTVELFNVINERLKKKGVLPDILDYGIETSNAVELRSYQFDVIGIVNFGGSEGIYLDIYADGIVDDSNTRKKIELGTYKTLHDDIDDFKVMGNLNAEFVFAARKFIDEHLDDFEWSGFEVLFYKGNCKHYSYGYTYSTFDEAKNRIVRELKRPGATVTRAVITDNTNRTFTEFDPEAVSNMELVQAFLNASVNQIEWLLGYPVSAYVLETLEDRITEAVSNLCEERIDACAGFWNPIWKEVEIDA